MVFFLGSTSYLKLRNDMACFYAAVLRGVCNVAVVGRFLAF